jgi:hypothetical protein
LVHLNFPPKANIVSGGILWHVLKSSSSNYYICFRFEVIIDENGH